MPVGSPAVREQRIETDGVPARLYEPEGAEGLLLLGHGGGSSKDEPRFVDLGRRYAQDTGLAVVCIDIVGHGERASTPVAAPRPDEIMPWIMEKVDQTVTDWKATVAALSSIGPPVAYAGFSMGMLLGAPTVVAIPNIRAVVFGVGGIPVALGDASVLTRYAAQLGDRQLLMLNMSLDPIFPPAGALEFFGAIPGRRKRIMFWEGDHLGLPSESIRHSVEFVKRHAFSD
jgi:pimeloyl-ACP methyl ester carboxylesterase